MSAGFSIKKEIPYAYAAAPNVTPRWTTLRSLTRFIIHQNASAFNPYPTTD